jgi:predicted nucleic acid-binding protein
MSVRNLYWDANVFHALFGEETGRVDICKQIQAKAEKMEIIIYTSYLTWVECIWLKGLPKLSEKHEAVIQKYFEHQYIRPIFLDRVRADAARSLVWKYAALHPKDAIHVASATLIPVDVMHTYDDALIKLSGKISGLKICKPGEEANEKDFKLSSGPPPRKT